MQRAFDLIKEKCVKDSRIGRSSLNAFLEIVNQVASEYGEEVCEWFKYDYRTIAPRNHDVENPYWRIPEDMSKLKYCPYCGKKIKVVEPYKAESEE